MTGPEAIAGAEVEKPQEACGVFAVYAPGENVTSLAYLGGQAGQNRGQDAAGIAVLAEGSVRLRTGPGLVSEVFHSPAVLDDLDPSNIASMAIAHTLYGTSGDGNGFQPIKLRGGDGKQFALAHNGHIEPRNGRGIGDFSSDSYWFSHRIARHWEEDVSLEDAIEKACNEVTGAYSCVVLGDNKIVAFRDPNGIRPLEMGQLPDGKGIVVASETAGFRQFDATHTGSVTPGSIVTIDAEGIHTRQFAEAHPRRCIFENVYFARPSSELDGVSVNAGRRRSGAYLSEQQPVEADVVVGVPNSGLSAAEGYAEASGIPFVRGLERNPYITRTFIKSSSDSRKHALDLKFAALPDVVAGKRLVVVDDSIVRGATMQALTARLREAGASEVHLRIASPPYRWPCYYGMATGEASTLLVNNVAEQDMAAYFDADSFDYLSLDNLLRAIGQTAGKLCTGCLTGVYPTEVPTMLDSRK